MFDSDTLYIVASLFRIWTFLGLIMHVWLRNAPRGTNRDELALLFFAGPVAWVANLVNNRNLSNKRLIFHVILALMLIVPIAWLTCGRW